MDWMGVTHSPTNHATINDFEFKPFDDKDNLHCRVILNLEMKTIESRDDNKEGFFGIYPTPPLP